MLAYETYETNLRLGGTVLCSVAHYRLLTGTITNRVVHPWYSCRPTYKFRYDKFQKAV